MSDESKKKPTIEDLVKAAQEGNVTLMLSDEPDDLLISDGDAKITLIRDAHCGPGVFAFSVSDGGGFTGVLVTRDQWESMKAKVDAFLAKSVV